MLVQVLGSLALLLRAANAVFADEAWNTDYHYALLGLPKEDTTFFHQPNPVSRATLIYTLSEAGVVGAVNPRDGALVWRQVLPYPASHASFLRAGDDQDVVVSGINNTVAAWSAADGRLVWTADLPGGVEGLEILELQDGAQTPNIKDSIVLTSGDKNYVQRLDGLSGAVKWRHSIDSGDVPYQVSASATEVFAVLLHKTMLGYIKIRVLTLDSVTGAKKDEYTLSSDSELASAEAIISAGANTASPIIAWTDAAFTVLKVNVMGSRTVSTFNIDKSAEQAIERIRVHAPHQSTAFSHFLVQFETAQTHWAEVFHVDLQKNSVDKAYALPRKSGRGAFSTSVSGANIYFTRITRDEVITVSSLSHGILGKWSLHGFGTVNSAQHPSEPVQAISEVSVKGESVSALRSAVLLSSGEWVLLRDGSAVWQRPEILAGTVAATFAVPIEVQSFAEALEVETHSSLIGAYLHRVRRHVADLQRLPEILSELPQRIAGGFLGTTADSGLNGDSFGFHQIIACAVSNGRVIALDAGNPSKILWSQQVADLQLGQSWQPTFDTSSGEVLTIEQGTGLQRIHLNASTGETLPTLPESADVSAPPSVSFSLEEGALAATRRLGASAGNLWKFVPPHGNRILDVVPRPVNDPVASIGKVLGDRRVLYKYLSPNLALLVTAHDSRATASVYVIDTISGATLYSTTHENVDLAAPTSSIMSENWFAYSYTSDRSEDFPKGHYLVVGEMFESLLPNDRGPLGSKTNVSSLESQAEPFVLSKTYQIPEAISGLSVTRTRQGITSRQLLAVLKDANSIVGIPYTILDPRRPVNRDPTKDEQAEGLIRYAPTIEFDPKWYLNHEREVIGITTVATGPALIESTSLVFAYGLDIFGTRLSPSFSFDILGKDFNKFQMLATVVGLAIATFVVAPLVTRKQVNASWQFA